MGRCRAELYHIVAIGVGWGRVTSMRFDDAGGPSGFEFAAAVGAEDVGEVVDSGVYLGAK